MGFAVFGFGSIIFRPNFEYTRRFDGYVRDWVRVFWQGSTDHRGVPGAPGRTATLASSPGGVCWGTCFVVEASAEREAEILAELEWREKQYDRREYLDVYVPGQDEPAWRGALTYIATDSPRNVNYLGPAPLGAIAAQIARSVGPSGPNWEYLLRLVSYLREMGLTKADDEHCFALEELVVAEMRALGMTAALETIAAGMVAAAATARALPESTDGGGEAAA